MNVVWHVNDPLLVCICITFFILDGTKMNIPCVYATHVTYKVELDKWIGV